VFERFSEQARQVVVLALDEARSLGHDHIGSEHLLLGLLRLDDDLVELLGDPADMRRRVVEIVGEGASEVGSPGQLPFTSHGRDVIVQAGSRSEGVLVGPAEIVLALLALPPDATAIRALRAHGVSIGDVRDEIAGLRQTATIEPEGENRGLSLDAQRVLETAARHAEDSPLEPEHLLLALVLVVPDLAARTLGIADGGIVGERLARLLDGPERAHAGAARRDIAVLESALRNAQQAGKELVTPEDLLLGLLEVAPDVVARATVDLAAMEATIRSWRVPDEDASRTLLDRFSRPARDAIARAVDEARLLDHSYVGTEHLLLALIQDDHGAAGRVLADLRVGLAEARIAVERIVPRGDEAAPPGRLPFTARSKRVLELALRESFRGHQIDTGHMLLGIERDGEGVAVLVLERLGASRGLIRRSTLAMLGHDPMPTPAPKPTPSTASAFWAAEQEAAALGQRWVGCEHLLLVLIRRGGRVAAALSELGVQLDPVLWGVIDLGAGGASQPFRTARLVRTVRVAEELAAAAGRPQANEEDLLIALVRESVGVARVLLGDAGDEAAVRRALGG
jgi:ATP-dependent Clp protease ATP-binding subunit ClpA